MNKYHATPTLVDGIRFASKKEARRYGELLMLARAGQITDLNHHTRFSIYINGKLFGHYTSDFDYTDVNGEYVVEDCKSPPTRRRDDYRMRKRLMRICNGIEIQEV